VGIAVAAKGAFIGCRDHLHADVKLLGAIAAEARRLADCVREGSVAPVELSGATFTVSNARYVLDNGGNIRHNLPQAAIL
jgi:pyruvate/2-oxoglutarate dehydrogenase complex dihydrolipoamide acyltransferase (E2) component